MPGDETPDGWTLDAWIEHSRAVRDLDRKMHRIQIAHVEAVARVRRESDAIHFAQLNENMKRTIEERSHFVSVDAYDPFKDRVTNAIAVTDGRQEGSKSVVYMIVSVASVLFGLLSLLIAYFATRGTP